MDCGDDVTTAARLQAELAVERAKREAAEQLAEERAHRIEDLSLSLRMLTRDRASTDPASVTDSSGPASPPKRYQVAATMYVALGGIALGFLPAFADRDIPLPIVLIYIVGSLAILSAGAWLLVSISSTR